ncbi:RodZ domain-containing protein [Nocardiopsis sp. NPDC050513]|uniref:RodZ domain-containing protein n=1 Tax=Nocardiopsis sp. NPDC050513 TaxID=3364338 RepID=UPI0037B4CF5B
MAIVGAVLLLAALVALGGYFLYRSLPSDGTSVSANASEASADVEEPENMGVLYVRVIGESSNVFVRVPGGDVLHDQVIRQGGSITFAQAPLEVTIGDPAAVEVFVNGSQRDISDRSEDYSFTIDG